MEKHEVTFFKNHYIDYLKKRNDSDVCMWLENAIDFEEPDGYYFDSKNDLLVIFEHFDIDCAREEIKWDQCFDFAVVVFVNFESGNDFIRTAE